MTKHGRRQFVHGLVAGGAALGLTRHARAQTPTRRFTLDLVCGNIGVRGDWARGSELAPDRAT